DRWDLKPGHDTFAFMEQSVTDESVDHVLIISDKSYAEKADGRKGGVGTETQIMTKDLYGKVKQEKFIALLRERDGHGKECLPVYIRNNLYLDFTNPDKYGETFDQLMRILLGRPELRKPELGKPPAHLLMDSAVHVKTATKLTRL